MAKGKKEKKEGKSDRDGKEKATNDKKDGKDKDKRKGVTFAHDRLTELPPPRYPIGQEPPLPTWPITWSPVAISVESSIPGLSKEVLTENVNKLARPGLSMVLVHPIDLAEDEMQLEGTILAGELQKAKEDSYAMWPPASLLVKCLLSRSVLDRDNEHRLEAVRRENAVLEAKQAIEDWKSKLSKAKDDVVTAQTKLREYRAKLKDDMWARKAEQRLLLRAAKEAESAAAAAAAAALANPPGASETEATGKKSKKDKSKDKEKEKKQTQDKQEKKDVKDKSKKEDKDGKKQDKQEKVGKGKKGSKEDEQSSKSTPNLTAREQFNILEEEVSQARACVKDAEDKIAESMEKEVALAATQLEPFSTKRVYCILGMDSASQVIELACEKRSFLKSVFNIALKPKEPFVLPKSSELQNPIEDDASSNASTSSAKSTNSKKAKRAAKKEAKNAKKEAKAAAVASATPPLVAEIRALTSGPSLTDPARMVSVVDVCCEPATPRNDVSTISPKDQNDEKKDKKNKKEKKEKAEKRGEEAAKGEKNEERKKKGKENQAEETQEVERKVNKKKEKLDKDKKVKKAPGAIDESLPYEQIAMAVAAALERLLQQIKLYKDMGGDNVRIYKVPEAKAIQETDLSYYNHLLNEVPQSLINMSIIMHCIVEQVAAYNWSAEDTKAIEVSDQNRRIQNGIRQAFDKLSHPRWMGLRRDEIEGLSTRFEKLYNFLQNEVESQLPLAQSKSNADELQGKNTFSGEPLRKELSGGLKPTISVSSKETKHQEQSKSTKKDAKQDHGNIFSSKFNDPTVEGVTNSAIDTSINSRGILSAADLKMGEDMHISSTCGECHLHKLLETGKCTVHESHIDVEDEPILRRAPTPKKPYNPYTQAKEFEEHLNVMHEFDSVTKMSTSLEPKTIEFIDEVDPVRVCQHMSTLRATPARGRFKMPGMPEHSEEKRGASLTALEDLCDHYQEKTINYRSLEEIIFQCKDDGLPKPEVELNTMQRYKKLTQFLAMIKEDKDVFPDLDIPMEVASEKEESEYIIEELYDWEQVKYWCKNCLSIFKRPDITEKKPKMPLTDEELDLLQKEFQKKLVEDYRKRKSVKDQLAAEDGEDNRDHEIDEFERDMIEAGIFSPRAADEDKLHDEADKRPELDPELVKTWCPGCQSVFMPPPPPDLEKLWEEGERIRLDLERYAAKEAQDIIDAKIEAWERLERRLRKSIIGRRHAEGFADGLMGEIYSQAKLQLPFEILRYDRDEDCMLSCLYAANAQRNAEEQIPCLIPFGDFCATYDPASGQSIKKRYEVYELEPRYNLVLDERRYVMTEHEGLVVCGLPAVSPVQHEPRITIYKDGNVIMLRAIKTDVKTGGSDDGKGNEMLHKVDEGKSKEGEDGKSSERVQGNEEGHTKEKSKDNQGGTAKEGKKKDKPKKAKKEKNLEPETDTNDVSNQPVTSGDDSNALAYSLEEQEKLAAADPLSPTSIESERSVIACLKDGVVAMFFFAKDGTLHLQVGIPTSGRTFEVTSNGVVIFLPMDRLEEKPKPSAENTSLPSSPGVDSTADEGKGTKSKSKNSETPRDKGEKSKKNEGEDAMIKGGAESKSKNKDDASKAQFAESRGKVGKSKTVEKATEESSPKVPVENGDQPDDSQDKKGQISADLQFIGDVYKKAAGDVEVSRCVLPSGTVVSYKENGSSQILFNNGNVSEHKLVLQETFGWITTNNRGFSVLQDPPVAERQSDNEEDKGLSEGAAKSKSKGTEKSDKKEKKNKKDKKDRKDRKGKEQAHEKDDKKRNEETVSKELDEKTNTEGAPKRQKKQVTFKENDDSELPEVPMIPAADPSNVERSHKQLPSKKVIETFDPDTKSTITTREDLVVRIDTDDKTVRVVQHADGTHIYSEIKEGIEEYHPTAGQVMLDEIKNFNSNATLATLLSPSSRKRCGVSYTGTKEDTEGVSPRNGDCASNKPPADDKSSSETCISQQIQQQGPQIFDGKRRFISAQWHVRKDGLPHVHGNTNGGVAVEFSTTDGDYCVTWSRQTGQISLLMPNNSILYTCGKLVHFDPSDGTKRSAPQQAPHDQLLDGRVYINTNGIYEFNLERANLTFTDNAGTGFQTKWGYKLDPITKGLLPGPPDPLEPVASGPLQGFESMKDDVPKTPESSPQKAKKDLHKSTTNPTTTTSMATGDDGRKKSPKVGKSSNTGIGNPQVQMSRSSQVGIPLSPISECPTFESDSLSSITDPGPASDVSSASPPPSVGGSSGEADAEDDTFLGPTSRLFVLHEGGFGFEIHHEREFSKYAWSKANNKDCSRVREVYGKKGAVLHTFVTAEQKARKLAEVAVEHQETCRAPDGLKLWAKKVPDFARRIKLRAVRTKMQKRTNCDWLQVGLELPSLPRIIDPLLSPVLPLSNKTNVVFRQIFEYPSFREEQIPRMNKILDVYYEWQDKAMILTDVEQLQDTRSEEEIKRAQDIAETIRKGRAEQNLQETRERAAVEIEHATEIFRELRKMEAEKLREFEEMKKALFLEGERDWLKFKESKKGPFPCMHKPCDQFQTEGPFRPDSGVRLCYFRCEEGLQYLFSLQYQRRPPKGPRRWSVEALPPMSYSYQGSNASDGSDNEGGQDKDDTRFADVPWSPPCLPEEEAEEEPPCLLSEWMRELEMKEDMDEDDGMEKMCWELTKPERRTLGPADWVPCFLQEPEKECKEVETLAIIDPPKKETTPPGHSVQVVVEDPFVEPEEIKAQIPLPPLPPFWSIPAGKEWEINHEAVQRQLELIPNYPGWRKAEWRKNEKYLQDNQETLLHMNISSIGTLHKRQTPPKDWSHQFVVVPDFLDFGRMDYGSIGMKVLFLQNYHGTNPGRFRIQNLGPCVKYLCEFGMVPPGLDRAVRVFFRASELGSFAHEIQIVTEYDIFDFPIFAEVVRPEAYT